SGIDRRGGKGKTATLAAGARKGEFDPEREAKRKKRNLILLIVIGVVLAAGGITYQMVFVAPIKKEVSDFRYLVEQVASTLDTYKDSISKIKPLQLPDSPLVVEGTLKSMKSAYEDFREVLKKSNIYSKVEKYRLFALLGEVLQPLESMIKVLKKIEDEEKTAREEEWDAEKLKKRKNQLHDEFLDAHHKLMVKYETARIYLAALRYAMSGPHELSEESWRKWMQEKYGRSLRETE
ncbi:MAG: hypothetical protein N2234_09940, partial [Planctomycetota bacterium]|nr:hypothetical protein [Planctomycetota bacterium]